MVRKQRIQPVQERARRMRRDLLDATVHLLESAGAAQLTTTAIAAHAHVSTGTFYRYFSDKNDVLTALREEAVRAISVDLMAGVAAALDLAVEDGVRLIVETLVAAFERHRAVILAMAEANPGGTTANLLPSIEADLYPLATVLPRRHRPDATPEQLDAIVFLSMGVLVSTCLRIALQRPSHVSRDTLVDLAASMVLAGFR
ncbi:TetR/AcrR family transcriptional regulator [Cryptosporangium aurantiacum]|uniref:Transcriptional regulator, TetR family n=1 Tax=Cryptosporangium aurantiacum TaxID=134849 RepID=A0A1M7RN09_9ACTN|nr:TetR/AcrR family transcriptional regulator [Cryptosporangium aurantiacum]SHN47715.1 transcriptional regulator, TetR family [Cryptosporangium aurantiacum]